MVLRRFLDMIKFYWEFITIAAEVHFVFSALYGVKWYGIRTLPEKNYAIFNSNDRIMLWFYSDFSICSLMFYQRFITIAAVVQKDLYKFITANIKPDRTVIRRVDSFVMVEASQFTLWSRILIENW